jgi:hypothetical protein
MAATSSWILLLYFCEPWRFLLHGIQADHIPFGVNVFFGIAIGIGIELVSIALLIDRDTDRDTDFDFDHFIHGSATLTPMLHKKDGKRLKTLVSIGLAASFRHIRGINQRLT